VRVEEGGQLIAGLVLVCAGANNFLNRFCWYRINRFRGWNHFFFIITFFLGI
jgi:hypothetical protein